MTERQAAIVTLLDRPDPPEMPARRHVLRCAGHPLRGEQLHNRLLMRWKVRRLIERDPSQSSARIAQVRIVRRLA